MLTYLDRVGTRASGKREFPFDTSVTDKELYVKAYGKTMKDATLTVTIAGHAKFKADQSPNGITSKFVLGADYADVAKSTNTGGLITFKWAQAKWGGSCCKAATTCTDKGSISMCNDDTKSNILLFSVNKHKEISHSHYDVAGKKVNAMTGFEMKKAMDMPTAHLTTVRGRGALGSTNQKLVDVFWQMTSSISSSPGI